MRLPLCLLLSLSLFVACKPKPIGKRVPGTWLIDHYDEYTAGHSTGHALDKMGYIAFRKDGTGSKSLSAQKPHGALGTPLTFRYLVSPDSVVSIIGPGGREVERWLVTSNQPTYMEWVSVNEARDTVRTMYLMKR